MYITVHTFAGLIIFNFIQSISIPSETSVNGFVSFLNENINHIFIAFVTVVLTVVYRKNLVTNGWVQEIYDLQCAFVRYFDFRVSQDPDYEGVLGSYVFKEFFMDFLRWALCLSTGRPAIPQRLGGGRSRADTKALFQDDLRTIIKPDYPYLGEWVTSTNPSEQGASPFNEEKIISDICQFQPLAEDQIYLVQLKAQNKGLGGPKFSSAISLVGPSDSESLNRFIEIDGESSEGKDLFEKVDSEIWGWRPHLRGRLSTIISN